MSDFSQSAMWLQLGRRDFLQCLASLPLVLLASDAYELYAEATRRMHEDLAAVCRRSQNQERIRSTRIPTRDEFEALPLSVQAEYFQWARVRLGR